MKVLLLTYVQNIIVKPKSKVRVQIPVKGLGVTLKSQDYYRLWLLYYRLWLPTPNSTIDSGSYYRLWLLHKRLWLPTITPTIDSSSFTMDSGST